MKENKGLKIFYWVSLVLILLIMLIPVGLLASDIFTTIKTTDNIFIQNSTGAFEPVVGKVEIPGWISKTYTGNAWINPYTVSLWVSSLVGSISFVSIIASVIKFKMGKSADLDNMVKFSKLTKIGKGL